MNKKPQQTKKHFSDGLSDSIYYGLKKQDKKIKITGKLKSLIREDPKLKCAVDSRGRPIRSSANADLKRYYDVSDSEEVSDMQPKKKKAKTEEVKPKLKSKKQPKKSLEEEEEELSSGKDDIEEEDEENEELDDNEEEESNEDEDDDDDDDDSDSDSSSEDDSDSESDDDEDVSRSDTVVHPWGEMDRDAPTTDNPTSRLAICNLDWDRVTAVDLFVLFNSFKPDMGVIKSVTVYPSDFGMERMQYEREQGPLELLQKNVSEVENKEISDEEDDDDDDQKPVDKLNRIKAEKRKSKKMSEKEFEERVRLHELNRLKYYYAIMECDSAETADAIYTACNGQEYQSSGLFLDLRFVPHDMTFEHEPKSVATSMPLKGTYEPMKFVNTAVKKCKVELTWDETPAERKVRTMTDFSSIDLDKFDVGDLIASASEDEGSDLEKDDVEEYAGKCGKVGKMSMDDKIKKYRELLLNATEKSKDDDDDDDDNPNDVDMEITWEINDKEDTTKDLVKTVDNKDRNPWEKYLEKRKEKKKLKILKAKSNKNESDEENDVEEEEEDDKSRGKSKKKFKPKKETVELTEAERADLELLAKDLSSLQESKGEKSEEPSVEKKKKKKSKQKPSNEEPNETEIDPRFSAIKTDPRFAIDRTSTKILEKEKKKDKKNRK